MNPLHAILILGLAGMAYVSFSRERTQQVSRTGGFDLPCSADAALPFFTPEGEREWVNGWNPQPVFPDKIEFKRDTVFRQGSGDEEAVWTILDADPQLHRAEYVRVAPRSHTAHIIVKVEPLAGERSHVIVSYTVTVFGAHSAQILSEFSESAYAEKMQNWQRWISTALKNRRSIPVSIAQ